MGVHRITVAMAGAVPVAVDPRRRREQTVFSRVEPTGVAAAFVARCVEILRGESLGAAGRLGV